jgi:hypothetical protein
MRPVCFILVRFILVPALLAAEPAKLPEPLRSIADLANSAPPEFTADALLRMAETGKLADRGARLDLMEQAFRMAASAKFQVRMEGLPGTIADTASGSLSQAYGLKLDALSLQSRAVMDMLPLNPAKARELFLEIVRPTLGPLTCDDALVYEPSAFYQALNAVVNGGFTPKEKSKEENVNFLNDYLGQATSPSQLVPLAQAVQGASVSAAQHQILWARINGLLESMQADDRSFSASLPALSGLGMAEIQTALEKYRQKGHRCEGDSAPSGNQTQAPSQKKPTTPKLELYWQSTSTRQLLQAGRKLRFTASNQLLTDADRATVEWQQQLADYLNLIAGWTPDQEDSEAVYYHEKCLVYTALMEAVPPGPQNDKILADYVDFVSSSGLYQQSPAEWYWEPHTVLERSQTNSVQHAKVLEAYQRSGNPALLLEVALEKNLGTGLPAWAAGQK